MQVISLLRADSTQTDLCLVRFLSLLSVRLCVHTHTRLFRSVGPASRGLSLLRSSLCASSSSSSSSSSSASNSLLLLSSSSALNMGPSHVRFKTVKAGGSTKNNRDSAGRRLGMKRNQDQFVRVGTIIMRQRGTKWHAGKRVCVCVCDYYIRLYILCVWV
jgi:ribosomal protein L27